MVGYTATAHCRARHFGHVRQGAENAGQDLAGQHNDGQIASRHLLKYSVLSLYSVIINTNKHTLMVRIYDHIMNTNKSWRGAIRHTLQLSDAGAVDDRRRRQTPYVAVAARADAWP